MRLGKRTASDVGTEITQVVSRAAAYRARAAQAREQAAAARTEREGLAAREISGDVSPEQASDLFRGAGDRWAQLSEEASRLEEVAEGLDRRAAELRVEAAAVEQVNRERAAVRAQQAAAGQSGKALAAIVKARDELAELGRLRAAADELVAAAAIEADVDEPDWLDAGELKQLAALVEAGPRQPAALRTSRAAKEKAQREWSDRSQVITAARQILSGGDVPGYRTAVLERLPERLRDEAVREARALSDEARQRIAAAAGDRSS